MIRSWPIVLLALIGGCAQYEFRLNEPAELAQAVGRREPTTLVREPLTYQLQAAEGRLVMIVRNPTDSPIELLGDESYVVDPDGQSHPLQSQTLAPNSYIKLIFPPMRELYRAEPRFGFGVGVGISRLDPYWPYAPEYVYPWYDPYYYNEPIYLSAVGRDETYYWSWDGEGAIRLRLAYRRNGEVFYHHFAFRRVRV